MQIRLARKYHAQNRPSVALRRVALRRGPTVRGLKQTGGILPEERALEHTYLRIILSLRFIIVFYNSQ